MQTWCFPAWAAGSCLFWTAWTARAIAITVIHIGLDFHPAIEHNKFGQQLPLVLNAGGLIRGDVVLSFGGIVRRIYEMRRNGTAYGKIAAALNLEGIPAPRVYWNSTNGKKSCKGTQLWTYATVKDILNNERYRGILRMNYTGSRSYKDSTMIRKPESEWICHENLHEPIVSSALWTPILSPGG